MFRNDSFEIMGLDFLISLDLFDLEIDLNDLFYFIDFIDEDIVMSFEFGYCKNSGLEDFGGVVGVLFCEVVVNYI